jgi:hypothetical protein
LLFLYIQASPLFNYEKKNQGFVFKQSHFLPTETTFVAGWDTREIFPNVPVRTRFKEIITRIIKKKKNRCEAEANTSRCPLPRYFIQPKLGCAARSRVGDCRLPVEGRKEKKIMDACSGSVPQKYSLLKRAWRV